MPEYKFEILRTRTITTEERIETSVEVPKSVPEDEREDWVISQLSEGELTIPDGDWGIEDETDTSDYQEATQFDD